MLLMFLATTAIVLSQILPERTQDSKKKKTISAGLLLCSLVLAWWAFGMQIQEIRRLDKLADQVRYEELVAQGKKLYQKKKVEEVRGISEKLIAAQQGYGYFLRGVLELDQGRLEDAEAQIEKAIALGLPRSEAPYAWLNLGNAAIRKKNFQQARERFNEALKLDPDFQPARVNLEAIDAWEGKQIVDKYAWGQG